MGNNLNKSDRGQVTDETTNKREKPKTSDETKSKQTLEEFWSEQDGEIPRQVTAVVIGAGHRGQTYANFALDFPSRLKIVGVAEPQDHRREKLQKLHNIPDEHSLDDWSKFAMLDKIADFAIISTQDHMHRDPSIAFANKGYHLLLEKPMAVNENDCEEIAEACEANKVMAAVGHVMRYVFTRFF
jgi:predicted dehydrogenase